VYSIHRTILNIKNSNNFFYFFLVFGVCGIFIIIIIQIWSFIADVNTMNTSQSYHLLIMSEYFIDQEKYFYWILLHMYGELCVATAIMLATGSMFVSYLLHTCGMFRIAR